MSLYLSLYSQTVTQSCFPLAPPNPFPPSSLCPAPQEAGCVDCFRGLLLGSGNGKHSQEIRGWGREISVFLTPSLRGCGGPTHLLIVQLLSEGSSPTLQLLLGSGNPTDTPCPFKPRGGNGHSAPKCLTIPSDSTPLSILPLQTLPLLTLFHYPLGRTPCSLLRPESYTILPLVDLDFSPASWPCLHMPCHVQQSVA